MKNRVFALVLALVLGLTCASGAMALTYPIVEDHAVVTVGIAQSNDVTDYVDNLLVHEIEDATNVLIEFVVYPATEPETKLLLEVTGGTQLPDVVTFGPTGDTTCEKFADAGALYATDELYTKGNGISDDFYAACEETGNNPDVLLKYITCNDGHMYGMTTSLRYYSGMLDFRAWINQDWLDALNLQAPTNVDELVDVLKHFRDDDPNGNGIKDEIPMSGCNASNGNGNNSQMSWLQNLFIYFDCTGNAHLPLNETDGKMDVAYDKDEYREFLKFVNMLVKEELLDETAFSQSLNDLRVQLKADTQTVGMCFGSANGFGTNVGSWSPLEQPTGYYGNKTVSFHLPSNERRWVITADCADPELAFKLGSLGYDNHYNGKYYWPYEVRFGNSAAGDWHLPTAEDVSVFKELGFAPNVAVDNIVWASANNHIVQANILPYVTGDDFMTETFDGNEAYGERLHGRSVCLNWQYKPEEQYIVPNLKYTQEELDEYNEIRNNLNTYVWEARSLFSVGQLDPNNDADWQNYLDQLNALQYKDIIAVDQAAYDRLMN